MRLQGETQWGSCVLPPVTCPPVLARPDLNWPNPPARPPAMTSSSLPCPAPTSTSPALPAPSRPPDLSPLRRVGR